MRGCFRRDSSLLGRSACRMSAYFRAVSVLFFGSIGPSSGFVAADLGVALADGEPKPLLVDFFDPLNDLEQPCAATETPS